MFVSTNLTSYSLLYPNAIILYYYDETFAHPTYTIERFWPVITAALRRQYRDRFDVYCQTMTDNRSPLLYELSSSRGDIYIHVCMYVHKWLTTFRRRIRTLEKPTQTWPPRLTGSLHASPNSANCRQKSKEKSNSFSRNAPISSAYKVSTTGCHWPYAAANVYCLWAANERWHLGTDLIIMICICTDKINSR